MKEGLRPDCERFLNRISAHDKAWAKSKGLEENEAAGPVSRILSTGFLQQDGHSSGPSITARL
jgi:hypothetical protein